MKRNKQKYRLYMIKIKLGCFVGASLKTFGQKKKKEYNQLRNIYYCMGFDRPYINGHARSIRVLELRLKHDAHIMLCQSRPTINLDRVRLRSCLQFRAFG